MIITSSRTFSSLAIGILLAFSHVLDASNLNEKLEPKGQLGVRLDYELATLRTSQKDSNHNWMWSSHLTFNEEVKTITAGQLTKIAVDAYKEMEADFMRYDISDDFTLLPGVMSILAFDKEIILASSQKGLGALIDRYQESAVYKDLELCKIIWRDYGTGTEIEHDHKGKCGEVMTLHQYYRTHPETPLYDLTDRARATTVRKLRNGNYAPMLPCGRPQDVR